MMLKMVILLAPLFFFFLCSSVLGQELLQILTLYRHDSSPVASIPTMGVYVDEEKLNEVSNSVLMAEKWLRIHVLSRYPSNNINSIVIANNLLCNEEKTRNREEIAGLTLHSMKNIYYSLTRWGLEKEIKVSVSISSNCFHQSHLRSVFGFLEEINSTYTINSPQFSNEIVKLLISELKSMKELGVFQSEMVDVIFPVSKQTRPQSRKLSFIDPLWWSVTPPSQVSYTFSPLTGIPSLAPEIQPPIMSPASSPAPHYGFNLPPCNPYQAPPPVVGSTGRSMAKPPTSRSGYGQEQLWCVAKPSVPSEKLQEAMDYACGAGGADCGPITPTGSCYSPDSVVAHASYAFNSYWQKNKNNGGVC
ncbi:Glycoside hydrolase, catalytic domain-containing protein, partial [Cynara cardunculus var. scolymus]